MWTWLAKLMGTDVSGVEETDRRTEAGRQAANQRDLDSGLLSPEIYEQYLANTARQQASSGRNYGEQVDAAFDEGWDRGLNTITGGINNVINAPFQFVWRAIPLWIWIGAVLWILWELGWLKKWITPK